MAQVKRDKKFYNAKFNPSGEGNKISDGGGLFLHIKETGKYWRMNYRFLGNLSHGGAYLIRSLAGWIRSDSS